MKKFIPLKFLGLVPFIGLFILCTSVVHGVSNFTIYERFGLSYELQLDEAVNQTTVSVDGGDFAFGVGACAGKNNKCICSCGGDPNCVDCHGNLDRKSIGNIVPFGSPLNSAGDCINVNQLDNEKQACACFAKSHQIGYDSGICIRTWNAKLGSKYRKVRNSSGELVSHHAVGGHECMWSSIFGNGTIELAGIFFSDDNQPSEFEIVGGTGDYVGATGFAHATKTICTTDQCFACDQPILADPNSCVYQITFFFQDIAGNPIDFPAPNGY